jgi:hypothetical protein
MNALLPIVILLSFAVTGWSQEQSPSPRPTPFPGGRASNSVDTPLPDGEAESRTAPSLLPESSLLPSAPIDPNSAKPQEASLSPEQKKQNDKRIAEIRSIAMHIPRIVSLLGEANTALTTEAKRNFLRAYFITLCTQMRKMEPDLGGSISSFQREQIHRIARSKNLTVTTSGTLTE